MLSLFQTRPVFCLLSALPIKMRATLFALSTEQLRFFWGIIVAICFEEFLKSCNCFLQWWLNCFDCSTEELRYFWGVIDCIQEFLETLLAHDFTIRPIEFCLIAVLKSWRAARLFKSFRVLSHYLLMWYPTRYALHLVVGGLSRDFFRCTARSPRISQAELSAFVQSMKFASKQLVKDIFVKFSGAFVFWESCDIFVQRAAGVRNTPKLGVLYSLKKDLFYCGFSCTSTFTIVYSTRSASKGRAGVKMHEWQETCADIFKLL